MIPYNANSPSTEVVVEPLQRYECSSSSGGKFWEVSIVESTHYSQKVFNLKVTYGKLGSVGKTSLHRFSYLKPAKTAMARKVNEKTNKGYYQIYNGYQSATAGIGVYAPSAFVRMADVKKLVDGVAKNLKESLPLGAEVIVTVIAGPDVFQGTAK